MMIVTRHPISLSQVGSRLDDPSVGYITGRIMLYDPTDQPVTINESTTPLTFPGRSIPWRWAGPGCKYGFSAKRFSSISVDLIQCSEPVPCFAGEDLEAAGRASVLGWRGQYCPEVMLHIIIDGKRSMFHV